MRKAINKRQELSFVNGKIAKTMILFSGPYMLGILVQNLYGAVDLFVVGHYASTIDVSAVTIGSQLMTIITQLVIGLATGVTILIGQYYGANDRRRLSKTTGTAICLFGFMAIFLSVLYLILHKTLVNMMQTPIEAVGTTTEYLFYCSLGIIFIVGYNVISNILIGIGNSKTPFLFILIACLINVILDIILVRYVGLGAKGAAIATTVAQLGSFFFALIYLKIKGFGFKLEKKDLRLDSGYLKRLLKIGGPIAIQNVLVNMSFLFITAVINQMGVIASAAVGVVEKLITFLFVPATTMGTAVGTATAQNIGANQPQRARKSMWVGISLALIPAVIITVYCQFMGRSLTGVLNNDPAVIDLAANYLKSYILDILLVSFVFCMNGYFNSYGKSWFSLLHSLLTTFLIRVPLAFVLSELESTSLFAIGFAAPASTLVSLILCFIFLKRLQYKN